MYQYHIENFESNNDNLIAVVGNGPISQKDRSLINKFKYVYRFNDCKNMKVNDKITHLVVRQSGNTGFVHGIDKNYKCPLDVPNLIFIGTDETLFQKLKQNNPSCYLKMIEIYEKNICNKTSCSIKHNDKIKFNGIYVEPSNADWGGSSGFYMLADLTNSPLPKEIHIFGMNWNFDRMGHNSKWEKKIIKKLCQNCRVHPTSANTYI